MVSKMIDYLNEGHRFSGFNQIQIKDLSGGFRYEILNGICGGRVGGVRGLSR